MEEALWVSSPESSPTVVIDSAARLSRDFFRASATLTWMIERSITNDCTALGKKITTLLQTLAGFVRDVREARSDVDAVSRELHSLQTVLELLKEDTSLFPPELAEHTPNIIEHCSYVVDKLTALLSVLNGADLSKEKKRKRWLDGGSREAAMYRSSLEAHRTLIGLALDLVGAVTSRASTPDISLGKASPTSQQATTQDPLMNIMAVLVELGELQMHLPREFEKTDASFSLLDYMNHLRSYAESLLRHEKEAEPPTEVTATSPTPTPMINPGPFVDEQQMFDAYVGDGPDSAIDMEDTQSFKPIAELSGEEADESEPASVIMINDLIDDMTGSASRPPTPPPRDAKRLEVARHRMISPSPSEPASPTLPISPKQSFSYGTVTQTSSPKVSPSIASSRVRGFGRFFSSFKHSNTDTRPPTPSTNPSSDAPGGAEPCPPPVQGVLGRRNSRRTSIVRMPFRRNEPDEKAEGFDPMAVFGVPLQRSIAIAKGTSKTRHGNNGGSSKRDFPLCVQKCCFLLTNSKGVAAPDIFAEPGDIFRVAKLKEIFSTGPSYGEQLDWTDYTVYDAADLIMLFLAQLPKPLIPESLAKRWISLSRQATLSGSHPTRLDQCIDFWEEALSGLRGASRSLFKLLLNVWAGVAAAEEENDMTAERLAGVLLKPVLHINSGPNRTDYLLSLAFLIRKRIEYMALLKENESAVNRIEAAAW
ncbi:Rho GTPase activation protein [Xylariaceae sp. FL0255]|nr:Rho GTPase activation protein [Xylariaceae sp. FL0255]